MTNKFCNAKNIKAELDSYVLGQEHGKRAISMAIAQHLLQAEEQKWHPEERIQTDNVLIIGPTGCGKTETFRVLKKLETEFKCPVMMFNSLDYSGTGSWRNTVPLSRIFDDVFLRAADIYYEIYGDKADADKQKEGITKIANRAIILLDEFDKIALAGEDNGRLMLREYQSTLLKMIEGNTYSIQDWTHIRTTNNALTDEESEEVLDITENEVDTTNMMFIFLGAFSGIENITRFRLHQEQLAKEHKRQSAHNIYQDTHLGFLSDPQAVTEPQPVEYTYEQLIPSQEDIIAYGFMRELVGRVPIRTVYKPLSEDALVNILLHSKTSAYREYQKRFRLNGFELKCDRAALREIAHTAVERGAGARGLLTVFSELLQDTLYELSGEQRSIRILLRGKDIKAGKPPLLHDRTRLLYKMTQLFIKQKKKTTTKRKRSSF